MIKLEIFTDTGAAFVDPIDVKRIIPSVDGEGCVITLYDDTRIVSTDKSTELYDELLRVIEINAKAAQGLTIYEQVKADSPGLFTTLPDDVTEESSDSRREHPSNPQWFSVPDKAVAVEDTNSLPKLSAMPMGDTMEVAR